MRNSGSFLAAAMMIVVIAAFLLPSARAWSNGGYSSDPSNPDRGTHDWIANSALTLQTRDVTFLSATYNAPYRLGTEAPDNPDYIGDTTKHHVYFHADGTLQDDASALRASQIYSVALAYLKQGDMESAAYDIGVMSHYISDAGVFGHTMGAYTDWGAEVHHSDYETTLESIKGQFTLPGGQTLGNSTAYEATLSIAGSVTFGSGTIKSNVWMDTYYDFSDSTFKASALASIYGSVYAVASAVNHLMAEAALEQTPSPEPTPTPQPTPEPAPIVTQVPQAPLSLGTIVDGAQVTLSWLAPADDGGSNVTQYLVFRSTSSDAGERSLMATLPASTLSWTDQSAQKGKTYHYWVVAVNSIGQSEMSLSAMAKVPGGIGSLMLLAIAGLIGGGIGTAGLVVRHRMNKARH